MKSLNQFNVKSMLLILLIFSCTGLLNAQKNSNVTSDSKNGLRTTKFKSEKGEIKIYLPSNLYAGDVISGTVISEPEGKNEKQIKKNSNILNGFTFGFAGKKTPVKKGKEKWTLPKAMETEILPLELTNPKGKTQGKTNIPANEKVRPITLANRLSEVDFYIPSYIVAGEPNMVRGSFDGDFANSLLKINNQSIPILAESPRGIFFDPPPNLTGPVELEISENNFRQESTINILELELGADKLDLKKGEQATIFIKVVGLEGLEENVPLEIENLSSNISISGGNHQQHIINPLTDADNGIYSHNVAVTALINGDFAVGVTIQPPPQESLSEQDPLLCDCRIQGMSYLISPKACLELGGEIFDGSGTPNLPELPPDDVDSSFNISLRGLEDNLLDGTVPFSISLKGLDDNLLDGSVPFLIINVFPVLETNEIVSVIYWYKHVLDTSWKKMESDSVISEGTAILLRTADYAGGMYRIKAEAVNKQNQITQIETTTQLGIIYDYQDTEVSGVVYNVSQADVNRARGQAAAARNRAQNEGRTIDGLRRRRGQEADEARRNGRSAYELERIDEVLDRLPATYKDSLKVLIDSLKNIRGRLPAQIDSAALQQAVDDAKARLKACQDRLSQLKKEKADLEKQRDDLKKLQDKLLADMDRLYKQHGYNGGNGYHDNGRYWYGYIGDESSTRVPFDDYIQIQRPLREASRAYRRALQRLNQLTPEIQAGEEECNRLNEAYQQTKRAKYNADQYAAAQLSIDELCRQIKSLLQPLQQWSANNPSNNALRNRLRNLMNDCPHDSIAWQRFWNDYKSLIDLKKQNEDSFRENARRHSDNVEDLDDQIRDAERRKREAEAEERRQNEEAERLRLQREQELESARLEREARERERNRPHPEPYLEEEIDPSDRQLKLQASRLLYQLLRNDPEYRSCDCKTKALIFANNKNTSVTDLIGSIAVGVAFAPLEAIPGIGLAEKIGIGAVKALASSVYGGANLSNELVGNLFNAIGGEIFPKLTGDSFTGGILNELANGGIKKIIEEEGVRAQSWEGKTHSPRCSPPDIKGKTTMLFNPKTGWVVMMIKIENCPLVIVKYKVNKDGVPDDHTLSVTEVN
ncbi:MAG: hypothetical protein HQ541_01340 [Mariniphaga sp.]|nr:hypothetical protein [Mariniphaga sp.]